jgi:hypothetical protein
MKDLSHRRKAAQENVCCNEDEKESLHGSTLQPTAQSSASRLF